jgi:hypothetical protein
MIGKIGRVTGTVAAGTTGEVVLPIRGGTEAFHAHPAEEGDAIPIGTRVIVQEYLPPRTVYVSRV